MSKVTKQPPADQHERVILMLLTNAYDPDPRVRQEALTLITAGLRVKLLAWDRDHQSPATEMMEGVEVERVFLRSLHGRGSTQLLYYAALYLLLLRRGLRVRFDAVHCHDLDTLPLGWLLGKLKKKPVVYDAHESFPDMVEGSVHPVIQRILIRLERFLIRRTDLLITVGEKLRRHFAARGARHSVVVGNWKRPEDFAQSEEQNRKRRRQLGIPDSAMVLICITQLFRDREIEPLLEALEREPDIHLIIGGKGSLEELVRRAAAQNPRIHFIGFVPAHDIPAWTCAADAIYYGFDPQNPNARFSAPNKLFEALAAGKPIVSGDFGEIADVIREFGCGIIVPEYTPDTIHNALEMLTTTVIRDAMARSARRCGSEVLNWKNGENILRQEYSALLSLSLLPANDSASARTATSSVAPAQRGFRS